MQTASKGKVIGAALSAAAQAIALWNAITAGAFLVQVDGAYLAISGLNFSAAANLNAVAAIIQTAIQAAGTTAGIPGAQTATVVWNSTYSQFIIASGTTGSLSAVGFVNVSTATGFATFSGNPANNDTITFNGTTVTFVTGTPVGNQVKIGATLAATLTALLAFLQASVDAQLVKFTYSISNSVFTYASVATGVAGNSLTTAKVSTAITLSGATLAGGAATDISANTGLTALTSGAYLAPGANAETLAAALALFDNQFGQQFYGVVAPSAVDADHLAAAAYIEGATAKHIYGLTTSEAGVLVASSTTDIAYQLQQLGYNRTFVQYSSSNAYAVVSALAKLLTVNYAGSNTVLTLMYKQEPGVIAETLNQTQLANLAAKNANVFVAYNNNTAILQSGVMTSGTFSDIITNTDWLAVTIQTALYNLLYTSPTKIPQTNPGNHLLVTTIESVCSQAVINGTLAPGVWGSNGFGTLNQGDYLPKGFYVYAPSVDSQLAADRAARKSVAIQVAAKLAGAIHTVNVLINVNR